VLRVESGATFQPAMGEATTGLKEGPVEVRGAWLKTLRTLLKEAARARGLRRGIHMDDAHRGASALMM
jgi:hypothetical protein